MFHQRDRMLFTEIENSNCKNCSDMRIRRNSHFQWSNVKLITVNPVKKMGEIVNTEQPTEPTQQIEKHQLLKIIYLE